MILANFEVAKSEKFDWYDFSMEDLHHRVVRSKSLSNGLMAMEVALVPATEEEIEWFSSRPRYEWHLFSHVLSRRGFYN